MRLWRTSEKRYVLLSRRHYDLILIATYFPKLCEMLTNGQSAAVTYTLLVGLRALWEISVPSVSDLRCLVTSGHNKTSIIVSLENANLLRNFVSCLNGTLPFPGLLNIYFGSSVTFPFTGYECFREMHSVIS